MEGADVDPVGSSTREGILMSGKPWKKRVQINGKWQCASCELWKEESEFPKDSRSRSGVYSYCRDCVSESRRISKYGDIPEAVACELCGATDKLVVDHDHSCCPGAYTCGKCFRGWLCHGCNTGLGKLGDSVESLEKAIQYLLQRKNLLT